jgi:multidrug efflux pump subunit AcrB
VGAFVALFVTGQGIDVSVGMGAFTLVGIAVNNAIVLVAFVNKQTASKANTDQALLKAASVRLRPILLTNLVTPSRPCFRPPSGRLSVLRYSNHLPSP